MSGVCANGQSRALACAWPCGPADRSNEFGVRGDDTRVCAGLGRLQGYKTHTAEKLSGPCHVGWPMVQSSSMVQAWPWFKRGPGSSEFKGSMMWCGDGSSEFKGSMPLCGVGRAHLGRCVAGCRATRLTRLSGRSIKRFKRFKRFNCRKR